MWFRKHQKFGDCQDLKRILGIKTIKMPIIISKEYFMKKAHQIMQNIAF